MSNELVPDTAPMQTAGQDLVTKAESTTIESNEQAQRAGDLLVSVKELVRSIEDAFAVPKKKAHEAHKSITSLEKRMLELPQKAEALLKSRIGAWQAKEAQRIREEERRLAEEARKREEENRLAEAEQLEADGRSDLAEAVVSAPVVAPVVSIPKPVIKGVSTVMKRDFRIVDPLAIKREFLMVDESKIRRTVQALGKDAESVVGGIVFEETPVTRVGGGGR